MATGNNETTPKVDDAGTEASTFAIVDFFSMAAQVVGSCRKREREESAFRAGVSHRLTSDEKPL